jgi:molecular chaperone HscA
MLLQLVEPVQTPDPHQGVVIGIDLGTTHSVAAYVRDGKPQVLGENPLIPSTLSVTEGGFKVGDLTGEILASTKRLMGRESGLRLPLGSHQLTPVEVASHILLHVKHSIEQALHSPLEAAVITVPAYFDEAARIATKQAASLAGIKVLRLINEPTAAALAYGLETGAEGIYAIYDFGGGTFDISLLKLKDGVFQVLATGGDLNLGGDDIDHALMPHFHIDLMQARTVKERLSVERVYEGVTREELETLAAPFVQKTLKIAQDVLKQAHLSPHDIKGVVLVGGMTRMPLVKHEVCLAQIPAVTLIQTRQ